MKKWKLFSVLLLSGICALNHAPAIQGADTCTSYSGNNYSRQNYTDYSKIANSYLTSCDDGRIMRVQNGLASGTNPGIQIEYYDTSYNLLESKTIPLELPIPIFGGFYETEDNYYILCGQANINESADVECFRITKYEKDWTKIGSCSLKDCNTTQPFIYGSADFAHEGDYLIVRTCHEMYADASGDRNQATLIIEINTKTMTITDSLTDMVNYQYGYASGSLNQFVHIEDGHMVALEHGNAYPRSAALFKYKTDMTTGKFFPTNNSNLCTVVPMFSFSENPDNSLVTGASIGGFEISDSAYLTVGNSIEQTNANFNNNTRNIFVASAAKNSDQTIGTPKVTWLTNYAEQEANPTTPYLVKVSANRFVVLWEENPVENTQVYYAVLDGDGNQIGSTYHMTGNLSDCSPVLIHNNIIWYTWKDNTTTFYEISCDDFSKNKTTPVEREGHQYEIVPGTYIEDDEEEEPCEVTLKCSVCEAEKNVYVPRKWLARWKTTETGAESDKYADSFDVGEKLYLRLDVSGVIHPYKFNIIVADPNILSANIDDNNTITIEMKKTGTTTITVQAAYVSSISETYSITVAHDFETTTITKQPTCSEEGEQQSTCKKCGYQETTSIPTTEHSYGEWTTVQEATCSQKELLQSTCSICHQAIQQEGKDKLEHHYQTTITSPTCTEMGYTTHTCSMCNTSYTDNETDALGHAYQDTVTPPTCTQQGYTTHTCSRCDDIITDTITDKLPHQFENYTITIESTCTQHGEKTGYCSTCNQTVTEDLPLAEHKYQDTITSPTCTQQGYTTHTCSVCGTSYTDKETDALGHNVTNYTITKESTCTQHGEKTGYCSTCKQTVTEDLPLAEHDYQDTVTSPTCTQKGYTTHACSVCGTSYTDKETEPLGHQISEYIITKAPTCTQEGEKVGTCSRCNKTDTISIAKISHNYVTKIAAPTYSSMGYTLHTCKSCNASYKDNYKAKLIVSAASGLKMNKHNTKSISLTWNPVSGVSGYAVFQYKNGKWNLLARTSSNRYTVTKLSPGTAYQFRIRAYKQENKLLYYGDFSKTTTACTKPKAVTLKKPKSPKKKTIKVSWKKSACTGYEVQISTTKKFKKIAKKATIKKSKTTSAAFKKLKSKKTYYVRIRSYIIIGNTKYYSDFCKVKRIKCK